MKSNCKEDAVKAPQYLGVGILDPDGHIDIFIRLSLWDRLKVLLGSRPTVSMNVVTRVDDGKVKGIVEAIVSVP